MIWAFTRKARFWKFWGSGGPNLAVIFPSKFSKSWPGCSFDTFLVQTTKNLLKQEYSGGFAKLLAQPSRQTPAKCSHLGPLVVPFLPAHLQLLVATWSKRELPLAHQTRKIAIASDFRVDGAKSPESPQKEGVLGSEVAARNRRSLATFHRSLRSQCTIALSRLGNRCDFWGPRWASQSQIAKIASISLIFFSLVFR